MRSKNNPNPSRVVMKNKLYSGQKPCFVPDCKKKCIKSCKTGNINVSLLANGGQ